jgi:amino acid transporter
MATHDYEKGRSSINASPTDHGIGHIVETKGAAVGEAADIYGDIGTAEQYGYVQRKWVSYRVLEFLKHPGLT